MVQILYSFCPKQRIRIPIRLASFLKPGKPLPRGAKIKGYIGTIKEGAFADYRGKGKVSVSAVIFLINKHNGGK